ncbi:MAG: acyl carrier protein [Lentisphaerae bacterium]|nr:acyl carrier protein [Lentisphaerota bacterium]
MTDSIEDRIKKMIVNRLFMRIDPSEIDNTKSLIDEYGVDSVSLLELVVGIEEEFGIAVGDDEFNVAHFETVNALAAFVRAHQA